MYHQNSQLSTPPRQKDQGVFVAIDAEVGEVGAIPQEQEVSQCFVVVLRDELQSGVANQRAVTVEMNPFQGEAGLEDPEELGAVHLQSRDVHSQVGTHTNL